MSTMRGRCARRFALRRAGSARPFRPRACLHEAGAPMMIEALLKSAERSDA
jgi:hypothetical protein